jgi:CRISPR-associated endonuclease/helicase Cas3
VQKLDPLDGRRLMKNRYAHTLPGTSPERWEPIEDHLTAVASRAAEFAEGLGLPNARAWGEVLGRWHDLGKCSDAFQNMLHQANGFEAHLEGQPGRVDHSTAGAQHASASIPQVGRLLAYIIAGHHGGLSDASKLTPRLTSTDIPPWREYADPTWLDVPALGLPPLSLDHRCGKRFAFQAALFTRMLFSCLVDADRLATERFCDADKSAQRTPPPAIPALAGELRRHLDQLIAGAKPSAVNTQRKAVLEACRDAAELPPGLFSLTVPTGGGKTLASLEFALRHAERHGLRRVIVAIPFTSIIEQTADVYRKVFANLGDGAVLEHHSNIDPNKESRANQLAVENWDSSLVVTTNVQLLETLFANRTTPCRKLHRVARSVIVLDEAQTLPVGLLRPCLAALRELATDYGCSIVLCTATQPALKHREDFTIGLEDVREIIPEPEQLHSAMCRVACENLGKLNDDALGERLAPTPSNPSPSWLTIVNTKGHAAKLYRRLAGDAVPADLFHLSTLMCGQHRSDKLAEIKQRLKAGLPCRVVSTQLVEAGVDVDFPEVFRAMAGVDSIAQAAGRCNREGRLPSHGRLWLFDPAEVQPKGYLGATAATTRELLPDFPDPLVHEAVQRYFEMHYWKRAGENRWDDPRVMECFPEERGEFRYDFAAAADRFRLIEDATETVFVPYGKGARLIEQLRRGEVDRFLLRKLQRYSVGLYPFQCQALVTAGDIELLDSGHRVLQNDSLYDAYLGLVTDSPGWRDPESLVA